MSDNKELIEEIDNWLLVNLNHKGRIDSYSIIEKCKKALQGAEEDCQSLAATHLHEEAKLLKEIARLKAKLSEQVDLIELIDEIIDKVECMKGLAGKMAMGDWSSKMVRLLEEFKKQAR